MSAPRFAMVALSGVSHVSAGAMLDCYSYLKTRVETVLSQDAPVSLASSLTVLSLDGAPVPMQGRGILPVDAAIAPGELFDFIWLPSFRGQNSETVQQHMASIQPICAWLRHNAANGAVIGASGIAALVLMAAGLTDGFAVPVGQPLRPLVRTLFPRIQLDEAANFADTGKILISSGQAHDLPLVMAGMEKAASAQIGRWLRPVLGLPDKVQREPIPDLLMHAASLWLDQRLATNVSMRDLAKEHSLSTSAMSRRFSKAFDMSPKAYLQKARIATAQEQLVSTDRSIDAIARIVGYSDARLFRAAFRKETGMTASEWRHLERGRRFLQGASKAAASSGAERPDVDPTTR